MRYLKYTFEVETDCEKAYEYWTNQEYLSMFLAEEVKSELKPFGAFEAYFDRSAEKGMQGSEGMEYLAYDKGNMVSFTWNNPPVLMEIRDLRTTVVIEFEYLSATRCRVVFTHLGFGKSELWSKSMEYFTRAWKEIVLPRFSYLCSTGQNAMNTENKHFVDFIVDTKWE